MSRVLVGIVWLLWCVVDVLSVCAQEHFGGGVVDVLDNLLMCRCVSLSLACVALEGEPVFLCVGGGLVLSGCNRSRFGAQCFM